MANVRWLILCWCVGIVCSAHAETSGALKLDARFTASDSLDCGVEDVADAKECLAGLAWTPGKFDVRLEAAEPGRGDWLVRFPSARPIGNELNDMAAMEWFAARDAAGTIRQAPAIVV